MKIAAFLLLFSVIMSGCIQQQAQEEIKIGAVLPITGAASNLGEWAQQGLELAKDEEKFEYNLQDDQCAGQAAINAFNNLQLSQVKFTTGPICNAASIPLSKIAEDEKIIMITLGVSTKAIREAGNYSFTVLPAIEAQTKKLAEYINSEGIKSVSVLYVQDEYGVENKDTFVEAFSQYGTVTNTEAFERPNNDFRTILTKIKVDPSSAVLVIGYSPNYINIINQAKELDIGKKLFGVSNIQDPNVIKQTGNLTEGIIYSYPQISTSVNYATFVEKYNKKFSKNVTSLAMYVGAAYDAAKILVRAIQECSQETECVRNKILSTKDYPGVNGIITIDEKGNSQMSIELRIIRNGQFVSLSD